MDSIKEVSPFTVSTRNNLSVLSTLRGYKTHQKSDTINTLLIPVIEDQDVEEILNQNNRKKVGNASRVSQNGINVDVSQESVEDIPQDADPKSFVELAELEPKNRQHQTATVLFENFPALRKSLVDHVLHLVTNVAPSTLTKTFQWSILEPGSTGSHSDVTNVFVRFSSTEMAKWVHGNIQQIQDILQGVIIVFDQDLACGESTISVENVKKVGDEVSRIFSNKKNVSIDLKKTGTEDLDEVMQYYRTYKVENSELVEVPKDLKETIVKDIIKFRAKVLSIERDRRKKEIERERRKAKLRLTQIVEGIRSTAEVKDLGEVNAEVDVEVEEKINPLDSLNEDEYEAFLADEEKKAFDDSFQTKLSEMEKLESSEKAKLLTQLDLAANYESNLIDNKLALIDEIKAFQDAESARSSKGSKLRLYYTDHSEYVRIRNIERSQEEKLDALDVQETKEVSVTDTPKPVAAASGESAPAIEEDAMDLEIVVSNFSTKVLLDIQTKIGDLIEEFLGIKEEVLVDYIFEFVKEHNLAQKEELISELLETLDEDSIVVVQQLHDYIRSIARG